jgi:hypothetical protein
LVLFFKKEQTLPFLTSEKQKGLCALAVSRDVGGANKREAAGAQNSFGSRLQLSHRGRRVGGG